MSDTSDNTRTLEADVSEPTAEVVRRGGTFESFKHRSFAWFWTGSLISNTGTWMQATALGIVVFALRGRNSDVGISQFAQGLPVLLLALPAGVIADRVNKRKLLIVTQALSALEALALWLLYEGGHLSPENALTGLAWISGLALAIGVLSALTFPTWQSFLPDLVPREGLMNAIALNSAQFQSSRMLGPLVAGALIVAGFDTGSIFLINAASFLFVIAALFAIRPADIASADAEPRGEKQGAWVTLTAGLRYAAHHRVVGLLLLSTTIVTVFAMPYVIVLMQSMAEGPLHGGAHWEVVYSWLLTANGFGAVIGSLAVAGLPHDVRRERLIPYFVVTMSAILIAFSYSGVVWLSVIISALGGATFVSLMSLTNTSIQATTPGAIRGRVMALFVLAFMGIMPLSAGLFGMLGDLLGPAAAIRAGAAVVAVWGGFLLISGKLSDKPTAEQPETQGSADA